MGDARSMNMLEDETVELVVTSPPYPMITMWDGVFANMNPSTEEALNNEDGEAAFRLMHEELDKAWSECYRVLKPGCLACINIGDAVRTVGGRFQLFANHARVITSMTALGFTPLPDILWRKKVNAPNKFMGSGMLPGSAYVTFEHEYILIFRKGGKRAFNRSEEKARRRKSAYFWEERNTWFSDVWEGLPGARQGLTGREGRQRSAAFPHELAYRLICMHSIYGDTVLDPFLGTGTSSLAAVTSSRNSIGVEVDPHLEGAINHTICNALTVGRQRVETRLSDHRRFMEEIKKRGKVFRHWNSNLDLPVVTGQEKEMELFIPREIEALPGRNYLVQYDQIAPASSEPGKSV